MKPALGQPTRWSTPRRIVLLVLAILAARLVYLIALTPYELAADEAHYWEWSRRLALSYYTKGPGVAWTIRASTELFGHAEWAIRLPAAIFSAITMISLAILGTRCAEGDWRVGGLSALIFTLVPGYLGTSQFMTIDMPYFMCTVLAVLAAQLALTARRPSARTLAWAALGLLLGVGALYKYTILLLLPGLIVLLTLERRNLRRTGPTPAGLVGNLLLAVAMFAVGMLPILIWNIREGWPTVAHLMGHVHMPGGDAAAREGWSYDPMWTVLAIAGQLGVIGPPVMLLLFLGVRRAIMKSVPLQLDPTSSRLLLCCGLPVLIFYAGVSLLTDIEANWPMAAYLPLIPLAAAPLIDELSRYAALVRSWLATPDQTRPKMGFLRRKPETIWQVAWHWTLGWGIVSAAAIAFGPYARHIPALADFDGFHRISGHQAWAMEIAQERDELTQRLGAVPLLMAQKYQTSSLLAFYLPDAPVRVFNANHWFGARLTAYDFFPDTDLRDASLLGRNFMLFGADSARWENTFRFDVVTALDEDEPLFLGLNYQGPVGANPPSAR